MAVDQERVRRGFWMRMARERANLSQPAAAKLLGLSDRSASTISAWEAGTREPSPSTLTRIARTYAVPVSLFTEPEPTAYERIDELADAIAAPSAEEQAEATRRRAWWLADLREKRGLTRGQVASRMGTSTRTIANWEEGISEPSIREESALAELLQAPIRRPPSPAPQREERRRKSA